ncbi:MAG: tetratricopeptide repeat protein [Blautia sp.]|nr:tetratricopeptide repeat protein [Blautia sp.]
MAESYSEKYEIIGQIGEGGGGIIYKAYHRGLRKFVVLKMIKGGFRKGIGSRIEVDILKNLKHPNLPQVYDFLTINGNLYTVMDFIPGKSFKEYLDQGCRFGQDEVLEWMTELAQTLDYLHTRKRPIIHCDIKPGNIMLQPDNRICLIDFNVSAGAEGNSVVTGYTRAYAPPEQVWAVTYNRTQPDPAKWMGIDGRSDIYSLGASIYHMLSGVYPAGHGSRNDGKKEPIVPIRKVVPGIRRDFAEIIMKCLEEDLDKRYQSARELVEALEKIRHPAWHRYLAAGLCAAAAVSVLAAVIFTRSRMRENRYEDLVAEEWACIESEKYDEAREAYKEAIRIFPDRIDAYYNQAVALHAQDLYKDTIDFIEDTILSDSSIYLGTNKDELYYLLGNSYENMRQYERASDCYRITIEANPQNADYYREYAITLAQSGRIEEARQATEDARNHDVDSVTLELVEGQILYRQGETQRAKELFREIIDKTDNSYIQMRAYLMLAECAEHPGEGMDPAYQEELQYLEEAREKLPLEFRTEVMKRLADTYIRLQSASGDNAYYLMAADVYKQMKSEGTASYNVLRKLARIYVNLKDFSKALQELEELRLDYGDKYITYRELAYTEGLRQDGLSADSRDYTDFCEYYEKAQRLYSLQTDQEPDEIMDLLKEKYESIKK